MLVVKKMFLLSLYGQAKSIGIRRTYSLVKITVNTYNMARLGEFLSILLGREWGFSLRIQTKSLLFEFPTTVNDVSDEM